MGCEEEERNKGESRFCQGTCAHADVISMQEEVGDNKNIFLLMFFTLWNDLLQKWHKFNYTNNIFMFLFSVFYKV